MTRFYIFSFLFLTLAHTLNGQDVKKVLFIGNSYTSVNNLPLMVSNVAGSTGNTLIFDSNAPGGFRFMNHATNAVTLQKISAQGWDYVVLQAQSQETSLSQAQMQQEVFPYAEILCKAVRTANVCAQPMFYMTWGRKYGDQSNCPELPWVCTYEGMDDAIRETYLYMAETNLSELSPVGAVWRSLRTQHPEIELYSSDNSHPSVAGSYAAACAFYTIIYKKDPTLIAWNSTLSDEDANNIKLAAKTVVFDDLEYWDFTVNPASADFTCEINENEVSFTYTGNDFDALLWDFGDMQTATQLNPVHTYNAGGDYTVTLTATRCGKQDVKSDVITINSAVNTDLKEQVNISLYPNPATERIHIQTAQCYRQIFIKVSDFSGRLILEKKVCDVNKFDLDVSALSAGPYVVGMIADGVPCSAEFYKQ
ncbi:MAG: PKD domain-containing protein [Lentimicrobiaceae bacterium]|nr:PKD domain-containing protein [Lentimicrobiaceae bacterium]